MQGDHPSAHGPNPHNHHRWTSHRTLQRRRKTVDATVQKANQGRGKDVERKSPKPDFPSQLANPAHYAGFALSHRLYGYQFMKPDISLATKSGHFYLLTTRQGCPRHSSDGATSITKRRSQEPLLS